MRKSLHIIIVVFVLSGCADSTPMKITDQYSDYVGVWQLRFEEIEANSIKIDNMLLSISADGAAVYRKCQVNETKFKNAKRSLHSSTSFPAAVVTQITENKITLVQELGWFGFSNELSVDKAPYQENGNWYIGVEGKKLAKLQGRDVHTKTNWDCPTDDG